jgi:hypothetical protein
MDRDRSLAEFLGGESDGSTAPDADANTDGDSADPAASESDAGTDTDADAPGPTTDPADGADDVEPADVTYQWDPDGARCTDCGSTVDRLWSGASGPVCAACKEW